MVEEITKPASEISIDDLRTKLNETISDFETRITSLEA